ncbi:putative feruloyl esterase [Colletotrichum trifolii]|uniref:Carboxylic ester hydrolase n=1 Tax=Colletotrichum trifolii TaxID=5466 RepID=A0A4R8QWT2_COLTR|nr:putative feruloyl esterase [Colletotrichum trifolii]
MKSLLRGPESWRCLLQGLVWRTATRARIYAHHSTAASDCVAISPAQLDYQPLVDDLFTQGQRVLGAANPSTAAFSQRPCEKVEIPSFGGFDVTYSLGSEVYNYTLPYLPSVPAINFCNYTLALNHHGADDIVFVSIWLPLDDWNGRFLATGGGGLAAGTFESELTEPVSKGYAAGSTDAGLTLNHTIDANSGKWALRADGTINEALIDNFSSRSIHEMALIGKAAVEVFNGVKPRHSYFRGCSQGGRQGYFAAQYEPGDFDGILANAPAINTPQVSPADFWPSVVMGNIAAPPQCVFERYQQAIIDECDPLDGAADGLISAPEKCVYDTEKLIGQEVNCSDTGGPLSITTEHAEVVGKILEGPRSSSDESLWYGNPPGASFSGLANTATNNGVTVPVPFSPAEAWMRYFVAQDPALDTASLSFAEFEDIFGKSVDKYTKPYGTDNPDLTAFKNAGGKLLTWHGLADPPITHPGTTLYWDRLQQKMGGPEALSDFYRLFLAPGAGHCSGGYGPNPVEPLAVLVDWVENGKAPDTLFAVLAENGTNITRELCPYPQSLKYRGRGSLRDADSFVCED